MLVNIIYLCVLDFKLNEFITNGTKTVSETKKSF